MNVTIIKAERQPANRRWLLIGVCGAMLVAGAPFAAAQYQLNALDTADIGNNLPEYDYNFTGSSTSQFNSGTSFSGTLDNTGKATSIYSNMSQTAAGTTSVSNLSDSLATGHIDVFHSDAKPDGVFTGGRTYAVMYDTLYFTNSTATASTVTTVQIGFNLSGSAVAAGSDYGGAPNGYLNAYFGTNTTFTNLFNYPSGNVNLAFATSGTTITGETPNWTGSADHLVDLETFTFTGQTGVCGVGMILDAGGSGVTYNYDYNIGVQTTGSTTYTSGSGVFLSQAVPEPANFAVLGLAVLPLALRRRK